ncbi:Rossmann-fold NAD(P)-binding domain-containing protein [Lacunimicrobium album]
MASKSNDAQGAPVFADPRTFYPKPPFKDQKAFEPPGDTEDMNPQPQYGLETYVGNNALQGRVALITGGDSGIGRAIAIAYAKEGAKVAISFLDEEKDARDTADMIKKCGSEALLLPGDIQDRKHCDTIIQKTVSKFGSCDILVNNAAYQMTVDDIKDIDDEMFDRTVKTNIYAMFYLSREAIKHMKPGGSIINTASIQGYDPSPELLAYAMTKSAMIGFTKGLAKMAMVNHGIRVNAVAPGPVWTPLIPTTMPEEKFQNFGSDTIFQRPAQPAELAPLYVWLASSLASYVTGEVYGCTGGKTPF